MSQKCVRLFAPTFATVSTANRRGSRRERLTTVALQTHQRFRHVGAKLVVVIDDVGGDEAQNVRMAERAEFVELALAELRRLLA